jgi:uncharacterized membrane-anchored protein
MKVRYLKSLKTSKRSTTLCLAAILGAFSLTLQPQCRAQNSSSLDSGMFSGSVVNWVSGPQSLSVGTYADIQIPQGYRWVSGMAARSLLEGQNNPVPDDLIGVIAPDSGKWWGVVEFSPNGYLKGADKEQFDSAAALKSAEAALNDQRTKQSAAPITSLEWQSKPAYDAQSHSLSWALQVQTGSSKALDERVALLGRHGILQVTAIQPAPFTDAPSMKDLASNFTFKDGERYADYQNGDKVASVSLAALITGDSDADMAAASHGFSGATAAMVYAGLGACILVGGLVLVMQRKKHHRHHRSSRAPVATAAAPMVSNGSNGNGAFHASNGNGNGASAHKNGQSAAPALAKVALNQGSRKDSRNGQRRRRKVFNYPKFYTNVMRELSLHSYGPAIATNGKSRANGYANGHANGHANGNVNGANGANGHAPATNGANGTNGVGGVNEAIKTEIVELIASQKNLIQEQKALLEQQTKLIEEKRWLIEEQTAFLKGQSEGQFPLKFE